MSVSGRFWGKAPDSEAVYLYTLSDEIIVKISNYGGTVTSIRSPDRDGVFGEVVLGFDSLGGYLASPFYNGATIGRYANRIGGGTINVDGVQYKLPLNNGVNHLHGGVNGFDKKVWAPEIIDDASLRLNYTSPDGEEGYPGTLNASVTFTIDGDQLEVDYLASTDKTTVVNMTNHAYFNLGSSKTILDHVLWIDSDSYTPVDAGLIPVGPHEDVKGTPFDFREPTRIGSRISDIHPQLVRGNGYDQNFVLNQIGNPQITVNEPESGRVLEISTTMPGVQFYTGNFLDGRDIGRGGPLGFRSGLCLETQYFPDSPNKPGYPSTVLHPGEKYIEKTVYRFSVVS
ncbi:galactose mutarotase [Candidatus Bathyarchaeota archaeon]|nr:MAG: galactose mutarotase [Candidatus Bathyarchaeota archaeon]